MVKYQKSIKKSKVGNITNLERVSLNAAGIDIASEEHWVCVPPERTENNVRKFGAFTSDLHEISRWLKKHKVTTVAMESTGIYWIPLFQRLADDGFDVVLVNARHVKNVAGRTKTDKLDCQWIQKLHTFGLLQGSFRPDSETCHLRSLLRHRDNLIQMAARHVQHMQKALHQMNLLLDKVISDITGTTGLRIINAILKGERDPVKLAEMKDHRIKSSKTTIARALEGEYHEEHLFVLKQSLEFYEYTRSQIIVCDREIEGLLKRWDKKADHTKTPLPPSTRGNKKPTRNDPAYDVRSYLFDMTGVDLTQVPGFQASTVQTLISEVGLDMNKWATEKHFSSWLGVSPAPDISGSKILKNKTKKVQSRAAKALRMAALAVSNSESYLGAFYRRMRARMDASKAITATAHKLAIIFYKMVRYSIEYKELGADYYAKHHETRIHRNLERKAKKIGFKLVPVE